MIPVADAIKKSHDSHGSYNSHPLETEVRQFPTPEELWTRTFAEQDAWRDRFAAVPFEDRGGYFQGRYYQDIAIDRVLVHSDPLAVLVVTNTKGECMLAGRQCVDRVL